MNKQRNTQLKAYILNKQNQRIGIVIAQKIGQKVGVGWSLCCKRDRFDSMVAETMAIGRAAKVIINGDKNPSEIPNSIKSHVEHMQSRATKYFRMYPVNKIPASEFEKMLKPSKKKTVKR